MNPRFFPVLLADSAVVGIFGNGAGGLHVYADEAPPQTPVPYAVWHVVGGAPEQYLGEGPGINASRIQFDTYADDQAEADAGCRALRRALEAEGYVLSFNPSGRDEDTRHFYRSFDIGFLTDQF